MFVKSKIVLYDPISGLLSFRFISSSERKKCLLVYIISITISLIKIRKRPRFVKL